MRITIGSVFLALLFGCTRSGGSGPSGVSPYPLGQALVVGESSEAQLVSVDGCDTEACGAARERCGDSAYAEVVVDEAGQVLDVVCFRGNAKFDEIGPGAVATASAGNGSVLVFDGLDDGDDVTGDVVLTGNNAVIYGRGADVSRIGGDLDIDKNNAVVRGVSIGGDVRIDKNNAQLSFVDILGDLIIEGNNTTLAGSSVHGQVTIHGVNTVLVQNRFFSAGTLAGKNLECNGNVSVSGAEAPAASDAGRDGVASGDAGGGSSDAGVESPLTCHDVNGPPTGRGRRASPMRGRPGGAQRYATARGRRA
jgi:hypothetical protein